MIAAERMVTVQELVNVQTPSNFLHSQNAPVFVFTFTSSIVCKRVIHESEVDDHRNRVDLAKGVDALQITEKPSPRHDFRRSIASTAR